MAVESLRDEMVYSAMGKASRKKKKVGKIFESGRTNLEDERIGLASKATPLSLIIIAALVAIVTFIVFLPALQNKFITWDDDIFVYENPHIRSLNPQFFQWAFTNRQYQWSPLRWISHAVDYKIWGLNATGHHLSSIILHSLNAFLVVILVVKLLEMIKRKMIPSLAAEEGANFRRKALIAGAITGLLFSIHPLRVESVVWASARKDVLFAFFFLLSLISYLHYYKFSDNRRKKHLYYLLTLVFFIMSVMSKAAAVTLPFVLVLLDFYPLERVNFRSVLGDWRRLFVEKLPFLAIGGAVAWMNIGLHEGMGVIVPIGAISYMDRVLLAIKNFAFYLMKMIWPFHLTLVYGEAYNVSFSTFEAIGLVFFLAAATALCIFLWYRGKKLWLVVWMYYIVMLLPVSVIKIYSFSFAHDRYTYMPSIGPFLVIGLTTATIYEKVSNAKQWRLIFKMVSVAVAIATLISISYITIQQIGLWKNSIVFWNYVIEKAPGRVPIAHNNLGNAYLSVGLFDKAIEQYQTALSLNPNYTRAHNNLGNAYQYKGLFDKAIEQYQKALSLKPDYIEAYINLGVMYQSKGLFDKAIEQYQTALSLKPDHAEAHYNLGLAYQSKDLFDKAIEQYQTALSLKPDFAEAHKNLGISYIRKGLKNEAIREFKTALKISPNLTDVRQALEALTR
jgi:protein O-mannosyl-transferase